MIETDSVAYLIRKLGEPENARKITDAESAAYIGRVPNAILSFWKEHGRGSYMNGFFWICDPQPFQPILESIFHGDPEFHADDMTVVGYTAFGELEVWDKSQRTISIDMSLSTIFSPSEESYLDLTTKRKMNEDDIVKVLITGFTDYDRDLFDEALAQLGPLSSGEIYGFAPARQLGGQEAVENLHRVKIIEHLAFLCEISDFKLTRLTPPEPPAYPYGRVEVVRNIGNAR